MRRVYSLIAVLALVATACGGAESDVGSSDVRDFSEIAVGEEVFTFDPAATSGRISLDTNILAICAIAFGETEELGRLSTDQAMDPGGHVDHGALLTDLEPETTYFYRLQGVGEDGNLYRGELSTFTTPAAQEVDAGSNLAVGATVIDVSSEFSDSFAGANAIDGSPSTEWSTSGDGDDGFITIDLGSPESVVAVRFVTREMSDGSSIATTYTVTVDDGEVLGPFDAGLDPPTIDVEFTGQVIRFDIVSSTGGNTGAVEIEILGG